MRQDASVLKSQRIKQIAQHLASALQKENVSFNAVLDWIEVTIGLSRQKAKEYTLLILRVYGWEKNNDLIRGKENAVKQLSEFQEAD